MNTKQKRISFIQSRPNIDVETISFKSLVSIKSIFPKIKRKHLQKFIRRKKGRIKRNMNMNKNKNKKKKNPIKKCKYNK